MKTMKISDVLREWVKYYCGRTICKDDLEQLRVLADRIDSEMVELPRDADRRPIHIGDKVWCMVPYLTDGNAMTAEAILLLPNSVSKIFIDGEVNVEPTELTHFRPDSWEHIAQDLEDWAEGNISGSAQSFAARIRALAAKEG
jgi:hypothetical protein